MAVEILRDRGHLPLFDQGPSGPWGTAMSQDFSLQRSYDPDVVDFDQIPEEYVAESSAGPGEGTFSPPIAPASAGKKRKSSRPKLPTELRRPASTPQIRGIPPPSVPSPLESPNSEKRRNKLGYHRTSVACGHCRRRKIRCLLAVEDSGGRCLNCIRLKKDCHFYPVDQAPGDPIPAKARPAGEGVKPPSTSAHSSPRTSAASDSVDDIAKGQSQLPHGPFSLQSSKHGSDIDYSESPMDPHNFQSPTFSYQAVSETGHWGQPGFYEGQPLVESASNPTTATEYWSQQSTPNPAIYQHRGSMQAGPGQQAGFYVGNPAGGGPGWTGVRSMSLGDPSHLPQHLQSTYRQPNFQSGPYPYPYPPATGPGPGYVQVDRNVPIAPAAPHVVPSQSYPQGWNPYSAPVEPGTPGVEHGQAMFGGPYYAEPSGANIMEEGAVPHEFPPTTTQPG